MNFNPTEEQKNIIYADLTPQCVIACPGSGKTATAVRRLIEVRKRMRDEHGYVVLLSHSNTAVNTFRKQYQNLSKNNKNISSRCLIETIDSFSTTQILRTHGSITMEASCQPFLIHGNEKFLSKFKVYNGKYSHNISDLQISIKENNYIFRADNVLIKENFALDAIKKLGKIGAYTHELGRFWTICTLNANSRLSKILAKRFPYILIDEAQDTGALQEIIISHLIKAGSQISLIGDPHQSIFEFTGADGKFFTEYANKPAVSAFTLSQNRRSIPSIINIANKLTRSYSKPYRENPDRKHGAYYFLYDEQNLDQIIIFLQEALLQNGYKYDDAAIVLRAHSTLKQLKGYNKDTGQGATDFFAKAAIQRDQYRDIFKAFENIVFAIGKLLEKVPNNLLNEILNLNTEKNIKTLRHLLWSFLRDSANGLPNTKLKGKSEWHPKLKKNVNNLLLNIEKCTDFLRTPSWRNNLTIRKLDDNPLSEIQYNEKNSLKVRIDTVHQVKGESISAVIYLARINDINSLLSGPYTEEGRIGYVAITRARDLLLLGIPNSAEKSLLNKIEDTGFLLWD